MELHTRPDIASHPFYITEDKPQCCGKPVADPVHQPPLPKAIKCAGGHVLPLTDAYRFVTCPWCQRGLVVYW